MTIPVSSNEDEVIRRLKKKSFDEMQAIFSELRSEYAKIDIPVWNDRMDGWAKIKEHVTYENGWTVSEYASENLRRIELHKNSF